jgi:nitroreductase
MTDTVHAERRETPAEAPVRRVVWSGAGGRLFAAYWLSLAVVDLPAPGPVLVAGVLLVVAVCSVRQGLVTAVAAAGIGWLFVTGFVVDRLGELTWHGSADAVRLLLLVAAAAATAHLTHRGDR